MTSLIEIVDQNQLQSIANEIRKDCIEFSQLNVGSKAKAADQLYTENKILNKLGVVAIETIEKMDVEMELKDNKIDILEKELKDVNHFDAEKVQALLNVKPVIRNGNKERAKRRLLKTLEAINTDITNVGCLQNSAGSNRTITR